MYDRNLYPHVDWEKHEQSGMDCIRINFNENKDRIKLSEDIYQNAINVLKWVKKLPSEED